MTTRNAGVARSLRAWARTMRSLRPSGRTAAYFLASAVLCLTDAGLGRMSFGVCLLAVCGRAYLPACALGAAVGSALADLRGAAGPCACVAAVLCVRLLLPRRIQKLAVYAVAAGTCAITGLYPMVRAGFSAASILFLVCHAAGTVGLIALFRAALIRKSYPAQIGALCALLPGLMALRLPGGWSAAACALSWAACAAAGPVYACAGCAVVSALQPEAAMPAAAICLAALLVRLMRGRPLPACAATCAVYLLTGLRAGSFGFSACSAAGTMLALLLPPDRILPAPPRTKLPGFPAQRELRQASQAMAQAADMLRAPEAVPRRELAAILDAAGGQVCRSCPKHSSCCSAADPLPEQAFEESAAVLLSRGAARAQDLSSRFRERCIHPEAFLTAVNDALDEERTGRRIRRRLREAQQAARAQYALMSNLLDRLSDRLYAPDCPINFTPEISVQAAGRGGSAVSGDRGAAFDGPGATYYVLLCDGMGAGTAAAGESRRAVELLRALLLSGADAAGALRALNGVYLLRDDGCFSTVDLLRINLTSGAAILYKWGASASYLKRSRGLRLLGGAGLPPGLDPGDASDQIHLNLDRGDVLVLLSDGLAGKETRRRLEHCGSLDPRDVAKSLFAGREPGADDCTAVCVRLKRSAQRVPVAI